MNGVYFSGGGGLFSTATDYAQFALMLVNGGELNGVRLLSPRLVELMGSVFTRTRCRDGRAARATASASASSTIPVARNTFLSGGQLRLERRLRDAFWVDRKEKLVAMVMTQTSNQEFLRDFENMVMQAVVGGGAPVRVGHELNDQPQSHVTRGCAWRPRIADGGDTSGSGPPTSSPGRAAIRRQPCLA